MKHLSNNNFNNNQLDNVPMPVDPGDAVNKTYADTKVQGVNTSRITISDTEPAAPQDGDIWINPDGSNSLMAQMVNLFYPVGKLWWSNDATNPGSILGVGTWTRHEGVFIVAASDSDTDFSINNTGGAKDILLTAAQSGLREHEHALNDPGHGHSIPRDIYPGGTGTNRYMPYSGNQSHLPTTTSTTGITIDGAAASDALESHENLPPYRAKYCFERIA